MDVIQKNISPLIESQFPALYRDEGPRFVKFFKYYMEWLESENNPLYYNRRFLEMKDIDETIDEFLVYFKQKYLNGIALDSSVKTRQLLKHSLDLYRSKGTERGIDLLLRAEYGHGAEVYYPSTDLFKASSGKWVIPKYLEVSLNENLSALVHKEIVGSKSGATAFVERAVRTSSNRRLLDVLYISSLSGTFETGELVNSANSGLTMEECPTIVGSLSDVDIDLQGTGYNFAVGDKLDIYSSTGFGAKGIVTGIENVSGLAEFELVNGGYGYSNATEVFVSEKYLTVSNLCITNTNSNTYFDLFDTITQPTYYLNYTNANGAFSVGQNVYSYYANNEIEAEGYIVAASNSTATNGILTIQLVSGGFGNLAIYGVGNSVGANLTVSNGVFNSVTTANVIGYSTTLTLVVNGNSSDYTVGDRVYQKDVFMNETANGNVLRYSNNITGARLLQLSNVAGVFVQNETLYSTDNLLNTSNVVSQNVNIGVIGIDNDFISTTGNFVTSSFVNGTISFISTGSGASVNVNSNNLIYTEDVTVDTDQISDYISTPGNASTYGFPANPSGNSSTPVNELLTTQIITFGKETLLMGLNPGTDYNAPPFVLIYDRYGYMMKAQNLVLELEDVSGEFITGEILTQESSNGRGLVTSFDSGTNKCVVENLRVLPQNLFETTTGPTSVLVGETSGTTANVVYVATDFSSKYTGVNALVDATLITGNGAVNSIKITDSGFNFTDGEYLYFSPSGNTGTTGRGIGLVRTHGSSEGFYADRNGFLSDVNKLRDGYYYQEFSYDIRSSLELEKYENSLRKIMHIAGTKYFGTLVYTQKNGTTKPNIRTLEITT